MRTRAVCRGRFIVLLLTATLISAVKCLPQSAKPDDLNQKLSFRVPVGRVDGTFVEALGETARMFNIPIGISWVNTASTQRKRAVEYKDATVLEIIQDIAKTEAGYEVNIANNVVHVATKDVPADQNFLYLKIPQFSGNGVAAVVKAGLWMLLNQQIAPNPPKGYGASISHSSSDPTLYLQFTNATVEEILDRIALASDQKVWVVSFAADPHLTPTGFRRTESYPSQVIPADDAEPTWDIFRWDHWPGALVPAPVSASGDYQGALPRDSIPQYSPCPDQPKSFRELSDSFAAGRLPSASEITGSWVLIGIWVHNGSGPDLNCNGITRGPKFEWVLVAKGYSVEVDAIGTNHQTTTFKPDNRGNLTFSVDFEGDYAPSFRCRMTQRNTLACLGSPYYDGLEFKRMPANNQTGNASGAEIKRILNVALVPEQQTTLRVGESAMLRIPSDHEYSIISTGDVLVPVRRSQVGVIYRAVQPGQQTIVLNPHVSQGDCVSCASHHYFITVRTVQ
jgi:hypothetical protein